MNICDPVGCTTLTGTVSFFCNNNKNLATTLQDDDDDNGKSLSEKLTHY